MKTESIYINGWHDMEQLGIRSLTGESCAFSMRLLCDVNEEGRNLLIEYFGLPVATPASMLLSAPWNRQVHNRPSVGSIMLHRNCLQQLAEFALLRIDALAVLTHADGMVMGIFVQGLLTSYEDMLRTRGQSLPGIRIRRNPTLGSTQPHAGSRNVHVATGRTS